MQDLRDNIPVPAEVPILGNILSLAGADTIFESLERFAETAGPLFKLKAFGIERIVCGDATILEEICDEKRFWKGPSDALLALSGKQANPRYGLFAAPTEDEMDWQVAHRILVPAFGPLAIEKMFPEMYDMATQLVMKFARHGPDHRIPLTEDFTRLTLDTIALCSMDFRFNSFYSDEMHPFINAMNTLLQNTNDRLKPTGILKRLNPWDRSQAEADAGREYMTDFGRKLAQKRRDNPIDKPDLLNAMVNGTDPKTGKQMDNELIALNITTFLVAGHETTSGLLSFAFHFLLKNPATYFRAQQEVDRVVGGAKLEPHHLKDFRYLNAVLRETLRLYPTAPGFIRAIREDSPNFWESLGNDSYAVNKDDRIIALLSATQKDPQVYGEDAKEFNPDRMLDENFEKLPSAAWKPFGTGVRACIGRAFSWQESLMVMAMLFQNFNLTLDDEKYKMKIKQTLTIKPVGLYVRATLRDGLHATTLQSRLSGTTQDITAEETATAELTGDAQAMTILYGSNTGTCQSLAERLSTEARKHGFNATVRDMDAAVGKLPRDQPVVIVTASYEGQPPDNANAFVAWLESLQTGDLLAGVKFAVYGCGHSDWASTFHRIPKLCDDLLQRHGAERVVELGLCNAAQGDIFSTFDSWSDGSLWPALGSGDSSKTSSLAPGLDVELSTQKRGHFLRQDVQKATVVKERLLTAAGEPQKRHLEVKLPQGMRYETGDYLAILPHNPEGNIKRVFRRFDLSADATIKIKTGSATFLPTGVQLSIHDLLSLYVELSSPATKKDILACMEVSPEPEKLQPLIDNFEKSTDRRTSLLDILESNPSIDFQFSSYLAMLPPLRPRHYSISSSPLKDPKKCTVTYAIIDEAAKSGNGRFIGVTGAYMAGLSKGDEVLVSVRSTNKFFHLPADPEGVPVLMFCGGSGIAPFRGFIEERAVQLKAGRKLAQAIIFVGCRSSTKDRLYAVELDAWQKAGVVDVRYAFSKEPEQSQGCKYVQDRMLKDKADILRLWRAGAKVFTCGGTTFSAQVSQMAKHILKEVMQDRDEKMEISEEEAEEWFRKRRNERFVVDVFA